MGKVRTENLDWFTDANTGHRARILPAQVMRSHIRANFESCPLCGSFHEQGHVGDALEEPKTAEVSR